MNNKKLFISSACDSSLGLTTNIFRNFILWVHREPALYYTQVTVAIISLLQACLMVYLGYKGNILQQLLSWEIMLEMITSLPFLATVSHNHLMINLLAS